MQEVKPLLKTAGNNYPSSRQSLLYFYFFPQQNGYKNKAVILKNIFSLSLLSQFKIQFCFIHIFSINSYVQKVNNSALFIFYDVTSLCLLFEYTISFSLIYNVFRSYCRLCYIIEVKKISQVSFFISLQGYLYWFHTLISHCYGTTEASQKKQLVIRGCLHTSNQNVDKTRFWNNLRQVRSKSKDLKAK